MENEKQKDLDSINMKITKLKNMKIDNFKPGQYCDCLDETKNWCIAEVKERINDEKVKVRYEGWSMKFDEEVSIKKTTKINHFRRFSKGYSGQKKMAFRYYQYNSADIEEIKKSLLNYREKKFSGFDPIEITQNIRGKIFTYIDIFMTNNYDSKQAHIGNTVNQIIDLLYEFLDFSIEYLTFYKKNSYILEFLEKYPESYLIDEKCAFMASSYEILFTLKRIFGRDERVNAFYKNYEDNFKKIKPRSKEKFCNEVYYKSNIVSGDEAKCEQVAHFINYFQERKGLSIIYEIILNKINPETNLSLPFSILESFLLVFYYIEPFIDTQSVLTNEITKIKENLFLRISNLTEQEVKDVAYKTVQTIANCLKSLFSFDKKISVIYYEEMVLNYNFKCLTSKNLEKRIKGILAINNIINLIEKRENGFSYTTKLNNDNNEFEERIIFMDSKYLIEWLKEKNIIEIMIGENIHEEILKRSLPIFKLFANKNSLKTDILDQLWKTCNDKHESIAIQIEQLLCDLVLHINNEKERLFLFERIQALPIETYDLSFLSFIKNFTINAISKKGNLTEKDECLYGITLIWEYMKDEGKKVSTLIESSYNYLCEILKQVNVDESITKKYILLCLDNIKNGQSVVQSIILVRNLFNIYDKQVNSYSKSGLKKENFLKKTAENYDIMNLIINDIKRYMKKVKQQMKSDTNKGSSETLNTVSYIEINKVFEGYFSHKVNIECRLELIYFLTCGIKEEIEIKNNIVDDLWDLLVLNAESEEEINIIYQFFLKNFDNQENDEEFIKKIGEYLYKNILTNKEKNDFHNLNPLSFSLFEKYFKIINNNMNRIQLIRSNKFKIISEDIIGFDSIWEMLISVKNEKVRINIACLLANLCIRLKTLNEESSAKYWKRYNERLIKYLETCVEKNNDNGVHGIIILMKQIIQFLDDGGEITPYSDIVIYQNSVFDYMFVNIEKNEKKTLKIGYSETVLQVKDKLSYLNDIPFDKIILKVNKKWIDYNDDCKTFKEVAGNNNNFVEVHESQHPILRFKVNPKSIIMENKSLFNTLYELLHNSQAIYIDEAWELINVLPKNSQLEEEVKKLGTQMNDKIDWNKYIDSKSIYKLSYCLQIIKYFLIQTDSNSPDNSSEKINKNWLETFRKNKGIKHLITVIYQYKDTHFSSNLGYSCLNETINLLKLVTKEGDEIRNESDGIISKLFEIINFIFKSSEDRFNSEKTKEIQQEYKRKRDRQILNKSYNQNQNNNLNNNDEIISVLDEFHPSIRDIWLKEENSIQMVINFLYIFDDEKLINNLIGSNYLQNIINSGLILTKNTKIKQNFIDFLKKLYENISTKSNVKVKNSLLSHIFFILFEIETINFAVLHSETSEAYFKLFTEFLSLIDCHTLKDINLDKKMNEMTDFMINYIINFVETEKFDTALTGFLNILRIFILIDSHIVDRINKNNNLYEILIDKCIFSKCKSKLNLLNLVKDDNPKLAVPICRSSSSRKGAFSLLSAVCYNNPTYVEKLFNFLLDYHELGFWRSKRFMSWNIICSSEEKSSTNFVGLQNLGCICYMNSLLQQFYMIPTLRETILSTDISTNGNKEDYVLFQLQKIFSSLKTSDRQYHNPKDFCTNFKGFDNQPVNVLEQMDVDEFFNLLIDRVESNLKGSKMEKVFKYHFGGMLTNELICKGCPHYSEREESFNSISLQVKNKKSIIESLESFVEGEMLEGENAYLCEKCDKKVNTLRRQCLKKLPKTLIIVLKRFEFDYEAMTKFKVNDYCEFPFELNVEKYTQEYLQKNEKIKEKNEVEGKSKSNDDTNAESENNKPRNYYNYNLRGVLIHMGTAESGHYYSIIKNNNSISNSKGKDCEWFEFNDHIVRPYDLGDFQNDAFGGVESCGDNKMGNKGGIIEKSTNAYLLFYDREYDEKEEEENNIEIVKESEKYSNIPKDILSIIKNDNLQYWISRIIFSGEYNEFVQDLVLNYNTSNQFLKTIWKKNNNVSEKKKLINNSNLPDNLFVKLNIEIPEKKLDELQRLQELTFRYITSFFFTTLLRNKDRSMIPNFIDIIKGSINYDVKNAIWLLEEFTNDTVFEEFILDCPIIDMKKFVVGIIYCSLLKLYSTDRNDQSNTIFKGKILNFTNYILSIIGKITSEKYHGKDYTYVFQIIWRISTLDIEYKHYLLNLKILSYIILYIFKKNNATGYESLLPQNTNQTFNINITNYENSFAKLEVNQTSHSFLSLIKLTKVEKLTAIDEIIEKKKLENNPPSNIQYLIILFSDLIRTSKFNDKVDSTSQSNLPFINTLNGQLYTPTLEEKSLIRFNNTIILKFYINEARSKQTGISIGKLFSYMCYNNSEITNIMLELLMNMIDDMEHSEVENVLKIFKYFLLTDDNLKEQRTKNGLTKYFNVIIDNLKYYKFTDLNIDFIIKLFTVKYDSLNKYIESFKDYMNKLARWLKENPYPPQFIPSKTTNLYKKRTHNYQTTQVTSQIQNYHAKFTKISQEKVLRLTEIMKKNIDKDKNNLYDSDVDIFDYKFSHNELIKYENIHARIVSVLDEMICYENNNADSQKKMKQWIDTDSKGLSLCENTEADNDKK